MLGYFALVVVSKWEKTFDLHRAWPWLILQHRYKMCYAFNKNPY